MSTSVLPVPAIRRLAVAVVFVAILVVPSAATASPIAHASDMNCSDFGTQAAAQGYFLASGGPATDPTA